MAGTGPITLPKSETGELTFEDYLLTPETMQRYDIVDGVMVMSPAPSLKHQRLLARLYDLMRPFVRRKRLGVVLFAPLDVVIQRRPKLRTRQPDLLFIRRERMGRDFWEEWGERPIEFAPDLAVEILSSSEHRKLVRGKMGDYAAIGIPEVWHLDPKGHTVAVYALRDGAYDRIGLYGAGERVESPALPGIALAVDRLFEEEE